MDRYGTDVLAAGRRKPRSAERPAELGLVVEDAETGFVGAIVRVEYGRVDLEDRHGRTRGFPLGPGYLLEGRPGVRPPPPRPAPPPNTTASGSVAVKGARARVARASRIYVEGRHDAELVAQVWGDDLRIEGGVADTGRRGPGGADTLVVGHPYVDIWQAVKPQRLGLAAWPNVPRHIEWKHGACQALGLPHADQADIARAWRRIRGRVRDWNDLEPALIGRVEELIDFVTQL